LWLLGTEGSADLVLGTWSRTAWDSGSLAWSWIATSLDQLRIDYDQAMSKFVELAGQS
jgi:hypothetical protein